MLFFFFFFLVVVVVESYLLMMMVYESKCNDDPISIYLSNSCGVANFASLIKLIDTGRMRWGSVLARAWKNFIYSKSDAAAIAACIYGNKIVHIRWPKHLSIKYHNYTHLCVCIYTYVYMYIDGYC